MAAQELSGAIADIVRCKRKSEIEDGGRETGNTRNLVQPLESRLHLDWKPIYNYFRFNGRHLQFVSSGYVMGNIRKGAFEFMSRKKPACRR